MNKKDVSKEKPKNLNLDKNKIEECVDKARKCKRNIYTVSLSNEQLNDFSTMYDQYEKALSLYKEKVEKLEDKVKGLESVNGINGDIQKHCLDCMKTHILKTDVMNAIKNFIFFCDEYGDFRNGVSDSGVEEGIVYYDKAKEELISQLDKGEHYE